MDNTKKARAYAAIQALGSQAIATLLTLGLDEGVVETMAHFRAADHLHPGNPLGGAPQQGRAL